MSSQILKVCSRARFFQRALNTSAPKRRTFEEFKELQRQMALDEMTPVYLRKGSSDKLIFGMVCLGTLVCVAMSVEFVYGAIYPKPNS
ncbi:uncharacterized protein [Parasteatoda tepidariorum]